jgi:calcineurin-like phosphoesterase
MSSLVQDVVIVDFHAEVSSEEVMVPVVSQQSGKLPRQ